MGDGGKGNTAAMAEMNNEGTHTTAALHKRATDRTTAMRSEGNETGRKGMVRVVKVVERGRRKEEKTVEGSGENG